MRGIRFLGLAILILVVGTAFSAPNRPKQPGKQTTVKRSGPAIHLLTVATNRNAKQGGPHLFDKQAKNVQHAFATHHTGHFQAKSLFGEQATEPKIMEGIHWLQGISGPNTLSVIYFNSHGTRQRNGGFTIDTFGKQRTNGGELHRELANFKGNVLVVIETCNSGAFLSKTDLPKNVAVITACGPRQLSYGTMSRAIADGIRGLADANRNGVVDIGELARFVQARTKAASKGKEMPVVQVPGSVAREPVAKVRTVSRKKAARNRMEAKGERQ